MKKCSERWSELYSHYFIRACWKEKMKSIPQQGKSSWASLPLQLPVTEWWNKWQKYFVFSSRWRHTVVKREQWLSNRIWKRYSCLVNKRDFPNSPTLNLLVNISSVIENNSITSTVFAKSDGMSEKRCNVIPWLIIYVLCWNSRTSWLSKEERLNNAETK